jgi:hypothetical protein
MSQRPNVLLFAIICAGLLAGCAAGHSQRALIPPDTPEGQACLPECDLIRTQCEGRQKGREQECLAHYDAAQSEYDLCVQSGAETCTAPEACIGADMEICRIQYEECFTACGGRLEKGLASTSAPKSTATDTTDTPDAPADAGDPP